PAHRRRGIGTALWQWAATRAAQLGRTIVQAEVAVPAAGSPGGAFAARLGFPVEHVQEHLVVPLPYDDLRLEELRSDAGRLDGYRLTSWAGLWPPEHPHSGSAQHSNAR